MFLPATQFLPLALSILWPQLLTWNVHNTQQFCSDTWDCLSSECFLVLSGTFVYCFDKQAFPNYSLFTSHIYTTMSPSPNFSCLYCYNLAISFALEYFVECLSFCYFTFLLCFACLQREFRGLRFCLVIAQFQTAYG